MSCLVTQRSLSFPASTATLPGAAQTAASAGFGQLQVDLSLVQVDVLDAHPHTVGQTEYRTASLADQAMS